MKKGLKWFSAMLVDYNTGNIIEINKHVPAYSTSEAAKDLINNCYQQRRRTGIDPTKCLIKVWYEVEKCYMGKKVQSNGIISIAPYTYKRPRRKRIKNLLNGINNAI